MREGNHWQSENGCDSADWDASIPDAEHREKQVRIRAELFLAFPWNLFESQQNSLTLTLNGGDNSSFCTNDPVCL